MTGTGNGRRGKKKSRGGRFSRGPLMGGGGGGGPMSHVDFKEGQCPMSSNAPCRL